MKNKEDRIIEEIRETLMNYELPYEEGAWEKFCKKKQATELISIPAKDFNRTSFLGIRRIMAVAASLILLISIVSVFKAYHSDSQLKITNIEREKSNDRESKESTDSSSPITQMEEENEKIEVHKGVKVQDTRIAQQHFNAESKIKGIKEENINSIAASEVEVSKVEEKEQIVEAERMRPDSNKKEIELISPFESPVFLSENIGNREGNPNNDENWKFGVELSSSFISDKMNYGGGVFTERRLSDKVSLTSGLVFTKINAANEMKPVEISSSTRKVGVESSMQALDIPLSIVYQVSDGFYASMGVSLLTVLDENKSYQYETDVVSQSFVKDPKTGVESTVYSTVTRQYTEPVKEADSKGNNNIGYFNLSIGKKQDFYGKTKLLLEPFLKVPVGKLSDREVKLMNAGLKIKVMF
ncbi:hypothetical protein [Albibacterium bauzanense]|uniref:Outer membrane protein with beta-barrel domain n=1 Tax=Albibacterium bauzanense TaxID=653929 RepID=A0A4R1LP43_9SPHI|nr:hypothetical protein [Albibacterium bauzanense]TCK80585.1 hypothetical protein C8N28_2327 [Albibacterium bauzanense]